MARNSTICSQCGHLGRPRQVAPGSLLVEIILWCCLLLPGLLYSLWRIGAKRPTCRHCGAIAATVPTDSPRGRQLVAEFHPATPPTGPAHR